MKKTVYVVMHICASSLIHTFPAPQTTKLIISNIFLLTYINYAIYEINIFSYAYNELDNVFVPHSSSSPSHIHFLPSQNRFTISSDFQFFLILERASLPLITHVHVKDILLKNIFAAKF